MTRALLLMGARAVADGSVKHFEISTPSAGDEPRPVRVYLPPSYTLYNARRRRRYPTVYLLHGWPGSEADGFEKGDVLEIADRLRSRCPAHLPIPWS